MHQRLLLITCATLLACDPSSDDSETSAMEAGATGSEMTTSGEATSGSSSSTGAPSTTGDTTTDSTSGSTDATESTTVATDSGSSSTTAGSSGTAGPSGGYEPCPEGTDDCPEGTECQAHGGPLAASNWCAVSCRDEGESCPDAPGGTAEPTCTAIIPSQGVCALACDEVLVCPDGMECRSFGGSGGDAGLCTWNQF